MSRGRAEAVRGVEDQLRAFVHRAKRSIATRAHAVHPELQGPSYLLLAWLSQREPVRASAIVEALGSDKGALSRQLQHLEELGLVERRPDPEDGRATLVNASEEAVRRLAAVDEEQRRSLCSRLGSWSVAELDDLAATLTRFNLDLAEPGTEMPLSDGARRPTVVAHGKGGGPRNEFS